jgi:hypothetical protein
MRSTNNLITFSTLLEYIIAEIDYNFNALGPVPGEIDDEVPSAYT